MKIFSKLLAVCAAMGFLGLSFLRAQEPVSVPISFDFESNSDGWVFLNSSATPNHWVRGNGADGNETYSLYVSSNEGESNRYDPNQSAVSHVYLPIRFDQTGDFGLSFRAICEGEVYGETPYDYLMVSLLDEIPEQDMNPLSPVLTVVDQSYWKTFECTFPIKETGTKYLVFTWINDNSSGNDAVAIDDVQGGLYGCQMPTGLAYSNLSHDSFTLSWEKSSTEGVSYRVEQKEGYSGSWEEVGSTADTSLSITGLSQNTRYYYRVRAELGAESYSRWTDGEFSVLTPYSCPAPEALAVVRQGEDYVLSWISSAPKHIVYYKKSTEPEFQLVEVQDANSYSFQGWPTSTIYQLKVRAVCAEGDTSIDSDILSFATECGVSELPYREDFEASSWDGDNLLCWEVIDANEDGTTWKKDGYAYDGYYMKYSYSTSNAADDYLVSPQINLSKDAQLSFKVRAGSSSYHEKYTVLMSTTTRDASAFTQVLLEEKEISTMEYITETIDLSAYTGEKVYIAIKAVSVANQMGLYVDDFMLVTCPLPGNLRLADRPGALTTTGVWIDLDVLSPYQVVLEYKEASAQDWTVMPATSSFPLEITGLTPNTSYVVRAKTQCGPDEESFYSTEFQFSTPCEAVAFPFMEDFNNYSEGSLPPCWQIANRVGNAWQIGSDYSSYHLVYNGSNQQHCDVYSPTVDLAGADLSRLQLVMEYSHPYMTSGGSVFSLFVSDDGGQTWDSVQQDFTMPAQTEVMIPLSAYVGDGASQLQFRLHGKGNSQASNGFKVYHFYVNHAPICFPPVNVRVNDLDATSATIAWSTPQSGSPVQYEMTYQKEADESSLKTILTQGVETQILLNDLEPNTPYVFTLSTVCTEESSADTVFYVKTPVSCPSVENLRLAEINTDRAVIAWDYGTATFEAEYKKVEDAQWTPCPEIISNTVTFGDLEANTAYQFRVKVVCAADDESIWSEISFRTACEAFALPYFESFESEFVNGVPACWTYKNVSGKSETAQWRRWAPGADGAYALQYNAYDLKLGNTASMISPLLQFQADKFYTLDFWVQRNSGCTKPNEGIKVFLSRSHDTVDAEMLIYIHNNHELSPVVTDPSDDDWYHYTVELPYLADEAYLIFYGISEWGYNMMLDAVNISVLDATDIQLGAVSGFQPKIERKDEPVSVEILNDGMGDYVGELELSYQVGEAAVVTEKLVFTEEEPLVAAQPYIYTFHQKVTTQEEGELDVMVWYQMEEEGVTYSDTVKTVMVNYQALELPYETAFDGTSEGDAYAYAVDHNEDGFGWKATTSLQLASNPEASSNDTYVLAGTRLSAGEIQLLLDFGVASPDQKETLGILLEKTDGSVDTLRRIENPALVRDTLTMTFRNEEAISGYLRLHLEGEAGHSTVNVYGLSLSLSRVFESEKQEICEGDTYLWGDRELVEAGIYVDTLSGNGVDTVVSLELRVNPSYRLTFDTAICQGESFEFAGETYSTAGTFTQEFLTVKGCDSIYTITVDVKPLAQAPVIHQDSLSAKPILIATTPEKMVQWYNAEGAIEGATSKEYEVEENGIYHATASNECGESGPSNKIKIQLTASQAMEDAVAPVMYPNPVRDFVWIESQQEILRVDVYSTSGRLIFSLENCGLRYQLPVQSLVGGTYILKVKTNGGMFDYKMVVSK